MKTVLVGMNAQYIHTNLAVRGIAACLRAQGHVPVVEEFTINQPLDAVLEALAAHKADVYLFSCYIWNIDAMGAVAADLRQLLPHAALGAGGPQVAYSAEAFLRQNPAFDVAMEGEGEVVCPSLLAALAKGLPPSAPGLVYRENGEILHGGKAPLADVEALPFAYGDGETLAGRMVYYESMRGCPHRCSYCLSSAQPGLRAKSLPKVYDELDRLLAARPAQVKFVDRTFNCDRDRALAIWRYLAQHDNGCTNFHFEMAGDRLDGEALGFLARVRPGLFQFEIGVQSINEETLHAIHRTAKLKILFETVERLRETENIHLHLDLIAGLPYEGMESLAASFNRVYAAEPHQLQLGTLKVLPGTEMHRQAGEWGIVYSGRAPYEVLCTAWLGYEEMCEIKRIAHMVELYYNSGRFTHSIRYICRQFATPFAFWRRLAEYYREAGHPGMPLSKAGHYQLLGDFMHSQGLEPTEEAQWLCRYDLALHEKIHNLPAWVRVDGSLPYGEEILEFYKSEANIRRYLPQYEDCPPKQVRRMAHIEVFPFDPESGEAGQHTVLFDYTRRDVTGRAMTWRIELPDSKCEK